MPTKKLTEDDVRAIRKNRYGLSMPQWAKKLGVHRNTIALVRQGATWSKVNEK